MAEENTNLKERCASLEKRVAELTEACAEKDEAFARLAAEKDQMNENYNLDNEKLQELLTQALLDLMESDEKIQNLSIDLNKVSGDLENVIETVRLQTHDAFGRSSERRNHKEEETTDNSSTSSSSAQDESKEQEELPRKVSTSQKNTDTHKSDRPKKSRKGKISLKTLAAAGCRSSNSFA